MTVLNPERFEKPFIDWSSEERSEFLAIMNSGWLTRRKLTIEQVAQFEIWAEDSSVIEPKQKALALAYLQDKMLRLYGRKAFLKVMKQAVARGKAAKEAHDAQAEQAEQESDTHGN